MTPTKSTSLYNGKITIDFFEGQHRYSLKGDKKWLTSVTSVTGMIDKSRVLIRWAVNLTKDYLLGNIELLKASTEEVAIRGIVENACIQHEMVKQEAADKGTQVHNWCEAYIKAKPAEREKLALPEDEQILNGVTAFLKWIKDYKVKFIESEKLVYSKKYDYVGLMDLKAEIDGKLAVVDFKTSKGIYNEYRYQVAAYMAADEEESGEKYEERWIVKFGKDDGDFEAYNIGGRDEFEKDIAVFRALLTVKKREKELQKEFLQAET